MPEQIRLASSWLSDASYDETSKTLNVTTREGRTYTSIGVPPDVWQGLKDAGSPGSFYLQNIKGRY